MRNIFYIIANDPKTVDLLRKDLKDNYDPEWEWNRKDFDQRLSFYNEDGKRKRVSEKIVIEDLLDTNDIGNFNSSKSKYSYKVTIEDDGSIKAEKLN